MADVDISRAPIGLIAAEQLIRAVATHGDFAERHYLEIKSELNFASKRDKEKIAKFILGASNRMPDIAANAFEGYAIMVIGVSKGSIDGIEPVEMLEISKIVEKFVGPAGPKWDLLWIPVDNSTNQVLVIYVDPPKPGQRPFPCRANGESLTDGRIYIRAEGTTREATSGEIDLLMERAATGDNLPVEFSVEITGDFANISIDETSTLERFIGQTRSILLSSVSDRRTQSASSGGAPVDTAISNATLSSFTAAFSTLYEPEKRTEEAFVESITDWEKRFREAWPEVGWKLASCNFSPVRISVINLTNTFFRGVQANLHLAGNVFAIEYQNPDRVDHYINLGLPAPPRKWGPTQRSLDYTLPPYLDTISHQNFVSTYTPSITFRNSESVELHLDVGELRPRGSFQSEDEEFILIAADPSMETIKVNWEITAHDHNGIYSGEFEVPVGDTKDLTGSMTKLLRLESSLIQETQE